MSLSKKLIIILLATLAANACELSNTIDLELPAGESFPVIEAYLVEGKQMQILAFKSNTLQEPVRINMLWNASVYIIQGNDSLRLKNLIKVDRDRAYLYNYLLDTIVSRNMNEFCLYIESEEFCPISASCKAVGRVEIEHISLNEDNILNIITQNLACSTGNYYQVRCQKYSGGELSDIQQFELDFHEIAEGAVSLSYPLDPGISDSILVDLYRIDADAYTYHRSINNALNANSDPFSTASTFLGNIINAQGIFTFLSHDSHTLYF